MADIFDQLAAAKNTAASGSGDIFDQLAMVKRMQQGYPLGIVPPTPGMGDVHASEAAQRPGVTGATMRAATPAESASHMAALGDPAAVASQVAANANSGVLPELGYYLSAPGAAVRALLYPHLTQPPVNPTEAANQAAAARLPFLQRMQYMMGQPSGKEGNVTQNALTQQRLDAQGAFSPERVLAAVGGMGASAATDPVWWGAPAAHALPPQLRPLLTGAFTANMLPAAVNPQTWRDNPEEAMLSTLFAGIGLKGLHGEIQAIPREPAMREARGALAAMEHDPYVTPDRFQAYAAGVEAASRAPQAEPRPAEVVAQGAPVDSEPVPASPGVRSAIAESVKMQRRAQRIVLPEISAEVPEAPAYQIQSADGSTTMMTTESPDIAREATRRGYLVTPLRDTGRNNSAPVAPQPPAAAATLPVDAATAPSVSTSAPVPQTAVQTVAPAPAPPPAAVGTQGTTYTPSGTEVGFRYAVVNAPDLIPSHTDTMQPNPAYDQALQPRDRSRQASAEQIADIAQRLQPERLGAAPSTAEGAPIVGSDNQVESGNGRALAIRRAYSAGEPQGQVYRAWLRDNAAQFGLDPAQVDSMPQPLLVRVRDSVGAKTNLTSEERAAFAAEAGQSAVAGMSATEQARQDAGRLMQNGMLRPDAAGRLPTPNSREFRDRFLSTLSAADRAGMIQSDGELSVEGRRRIDNAILAAALDDPTALERALESPDDATRNVGQGVLQAAPKLAVLKQEVAAGERFPLDITDEIAEAANTLANLRERGVRVSDWLDQGALFDEVSPVTQELVRVFEANKRSAKAIGAFMDAYVDAADAAGNPKQEALFDTLIPQKLETIEAARSLQERSNGQSSIFAGEREPGTAESGSGAGERGAGTQAQDAGARRAEVRSGTADAATAADANRQPEGPAPRTEAASAVSGAGADGAEPGVNDPLHKIAAAELNAHEGYGSNVKAAARDADVQLDRLNAAGYEIDDVQSAIDDWKEIKRADYDRGEDGQGEYESDKADAWLGVVDAFDQAQPPEETPAPQPQTPKARRRNTQAGAVNLGRLGAAIRGTNKAPAEERPSVLSGGRFRGSYMVDEGAGNIMNSLAAAGESADVRATLAERDITAGLSDTEKKLLGAVLVGRRLRSVNPGHTQAMTVKMENAVLAKYPKVADAMLKYATTAKPEIEALRMKAGLEAGAAARNPDRFFVSLMRDENAPAGPANQRAGGSLSEKTRQRNTVFSRTATGEAATYSTDISRMLQDSYREAMPKARLRALYDYLRNSGIAWTPSPGNMVPPDRITVKGKDYPVQKIEVSRFGVTTRTGKMIRDIWVPDRIAKDVEAIRKRPPASDISNAMKGWLAAPTAISLTANPRELFNHTRRVMRVVSAMPPADAPIGARIAEALAPYIGPKVGAWVRLANTDMSLPENRQILLDLFDAHGGSTRAFRHLESRIPGLQQIQRAAHGFLFDVPEGKGIKGIDLRARVMLEKIRRAAEGNDDPRRTREFANQLGQYTNMPDQVIEGMKKINPFAATNLPLRVTEMRQTLGGSGLQGGSVSAKAARRAETFWRGAGGTIFAMVVANKLLSDKWPWQNPPEHRFDVAVGKDSDGRMVYLKPQAVDPVLSRVIGTVGLPAVAAESHVPRSKRDYGEAVGVALANTVANIVSSPAINTGVAAATGFAPHLMRKPGERVPRPLDLVGKGHRGVPRSVSNLEVAARSLNPVGELVPGSTRKSDNFRAKQYKALNALMSMTAGGVVRK